MKMTQSRLVLEIMQAQPQDLGAVCDALQHRYAMLYPDEEITFLSLPRQDRAERIRILEQILDMEKRR